MPTDEKDDFIQATMDMMLEGEISKLSLLKLLIIIIVSDAIATDSIAGNSDDEWFFVPDQTPKPPLTRECSVVISREDERACRLYTSRVKLHKICSECPRELWATFEAARARLINSNKLSSTAHHHSN